MPPLGVAVPAEFGFGAPLFGEIAGVDNGLLELSFIGLSSTNDLASDVVSILFEDLLGLLDGPGFSVPAAVFSKYISFFDPDFPLWASRCFCANLGNGSLFDEFTFN